MRGSVLGFAGGAALGALSALAVRRMPDAAGRAGLAAGLVVAAAAYPLARKPISATDKVELLTLALGSAVAARAMTSDASGARRTLAAGWVAHALFDAAHGIGGDSRLPAWYPPLCAGYDVALGAGLAARLKA